MVSDSSEGDDPRGEAAPTDDAAAPLAAAALSAEACGVADDKRTSSAVPGPSTCLRLYKTVVRIKYETMVIKRNTRSASSPRKTMRVTRVLSALAPLAIPP